MDITQVLIQGVWNASCVVLLTRGCNLLLKRRETKSEQPYVIPNQYSNNTPTGFTAILPATLLTTETDSSIIAVPSSLWNPLGTTLSDHISAGVDQVTQVTGIVIPAEIAQHTLSLVLYRVDSSNVLQAPRNLARGEIQTEVTSLFCNFSPIPNDRSIAPETDHKMQLLEIAPQHQTFYERD